MTVFHPIYRIYTLNIIMLCNFTKREVGRYSNIALFLRILYRIYVYYALSTLAFVVVKGRQANVKKKLYIDTYYTDIASTKLKAIPERGHLFR